MITSSYSEQQEYIKKVEKSASIEHTTPLVPGTSDNTLTPSTSFAEIPTPDTYNWLNPNEPENLGTLDPNNATYVPTHTASGANKMPEQGWTEPQHASDPNAGGFVRVAILSGSYGELKKLRVDSEINSETITTSWSASIGENLRVGNNAGIAGYLNLGDTASLRTGADTPGQDPQQGCAPVSGGISDLRLIVSDSALIQKNLYVENNVAVEHNLFVTGNTELTGLLRVVSSSLFTGSVQMQDNLSITGSTNIGQNLFVTGNTSITGTLNISGNAYFHSNSVVDHSGSFRNITVTEDARINRNLGVTGNEYLSGSLYVSGDAVVTNSLTVHGDQIIEGESIFRDNAHFLKNVIIEQDLVVNGTASYMNVDDLYVKDKSITVASGSTLPAEANGAGIDIAGAGVEFHYNSPSDRMTLNRGLDITGSLYVTNDTRVSGNIQIVGNEAITGSLNVNQDIYGSQSLILTQDAIVGGNTNITGTLDVRGDSHLSGNVQILGNVSGSASASFRNLDVENNVHIGRSASVDQYMFISGSGNGAGNSVFVQTGALNASSSIGYFHDLVLSGSDNDPRTIIVSGPNSYVSASMYYGDGRGLTNVTASMASSSTWKEYVDITAGATQRLHHLFRTTDVFVQVFEWDDPSYHPDTASHSSFSSPATRVNDAIVKIIDDETVDISYPQALNGYAVISDAGMMITASVDVQQCATDIAEYENVQAKKVYRFEHKLGTRNVIVAVYQYLDNSKTKYDFSSTTDTPVQIFPEQISIPDQSHIDVVFGRDHISGYIVIAKAGHVVKKIDDPLEWMRDYNVHYGVTGSWSANNFTAVTMSGDIIVAGNYVDAVKVGNRDVGYQYYGDRAWGSYTEYTDTGINEWVRNSGQSEEDIRQVSNIDKEGNLTIRGAFISNGTFSTSDFKKKKNIQTIDHALENIKTLRGVRFDWKDGSGPSIGVIAQEIAAIYPELTKVAKNLDGEELMTVNYEGLIGVLIEAVKSLSVKVEELENRSR